LSAVAEEVMDVWENLSSVLEGSIVRLEPLAPRHERGLFEVARDPEIWRWSPYGVAGGSYNPAETRESFHSYFEDALGLSETGIQAPFATLDASTGEPIGSTRYLALRPEHRGLEIGYTWLTPTRWRTGANVEAKLLMLDHAFGSLGCVRVEFKTDARNERSRAALAALPARFEGIFRKHMLVRDNERRDSAHYSIIDDEWPEVRANLRRRLEAARQSTKRDAFLEEAP
jgi:RimJ/RimL family protein N-acetyltransferase